MPQSNLATLLTWIRIAAIPLIAAVFYLPPGEIMRPLACVIFTIAGITDALDGYVARRFDQQSAFGAFLDPVADKLMVTTTLVIILQADPRILVAAIAAIIIGRELAISALREWMAELGARNVVAVSGFGKLKTILQMVGLGAMLWTYPMFGIPIYTIGLVLLIISAGLTLWSMFAYVRAAWPSLVENGDIS
ncbi:MAG: CDP-diacylglycerol--glycerol-3-phosphate 3-phosphatidyltransferase [Gammaproteobacteria bacterium]